MATVSVSIGRSASGHASVSVNSGFNTVYAGAGPVNASLGAVYRTGLQVDTYSVPASKSLSSGYVFSFADASYMAGSVTYSFNVSDASAQNAIAAINSYKNQNPNYSYIGGVTCATFAESVLNAAGINVNYTRIPSRPYSPALADLRSPVGLMLAVERRRAA